MEKQQKLPAIVWLRVVDFMHEWLQRELGGELRVKDQRVVCVQHLSGARDVFRMMTEEDTTSASPVVYAMSSTTKNCVDTGLEIDPEATGELYGLDRESIKMFVPIECPRNCVTKDGVLRPWKNSVSFGRQQAAAMQKLIRKEFWKAVEKYDREYAQRMEGRYYPAVDMIEAFCAETKTPDLYVDAMRREWQRRVKRGGQNPQT